MNFFFAREYGREAIGATVFADLSAQQIKYNKVDDFIFINLQFPFIDLRYFNDENTGKLDTPDLPIYNFVSRKQFVRNFGGVENSKESGIGYDENAYVNAKRAIRIDPKSIKDFNTVDNVIFSRLNFRRLFHDGRANYRLEIGLTCNYQHEDTYEKYSLENLIKRVLGIKVKVAKSIRDEGLARSVRSLLPLFLEASTSTKAPTPSKHSVRGADPMIYIETSIDEFEIPKRAKLVSKRRFGDFDLYCLDIDYDRIPFSVWIIAYDSVNELEKINQRKFDARNLRLALLRQHYERECLRLALLCVCVNKIKVNDEFQDYINRSDYVNQIINPESNQMKYNLTYKNLLLNIHRYQRIVDPDIEWILFSEIEGIRRSIKDKITQFVNIVIEGDIVMGKKTVVHGDINDAKNGSVIITRPTGPTVGKVEIKIESNEELFKMMREKVGNIENKEEIMENIDAMEDSVDKPNFHEKFDKFTSSVAKCAAIFAPFTPFLEKLIVK